MIIKDLETRSPVVCLGNGKESDVPRLKNIQKNVVRSQFRESLEYHDSGLKHYRLCYQTREES